MRKTMNSKVILTVLGLTALVATPALAAKKAAHRAPASVASDTMMRPVVNDDRVVGTDPDPSIRSELARDATTYSSTN